MGANVIPAIARRAVDAVKGAVQELTPGQRWTVSLMGALAAVVLAFGLPSATRLVVPAPAGASGNTSPSRAASAEPAPSATELLVQPPALDASAAPPAAILPSDGPAPAPEVGALRVVALVDPAAGQGDRTDEAMARRYLAAAGVQAETVPIGDPATTCSAARGANLALAGGALPTAVRSCLESAGVTTLAWDDDTVMGKATTGLSTRRGVARSLFDTAARLGSELDGDLALVADERLRAGLEPLLPKAKAAGLDFTSVTWLADGQPPSPALGIELAGAGVAAVVFATSTQNQGTIGAQLRTLAPGVQLVVLDAADSVTSAGYPPLLDGTRAVTSVQFPWHPGSAVARAACRAVWEGAQTPPVVLDNAELLRALTWCQHAAMADAAGRRFADAGGDVVAAVIDQLVESPTTTRLSVLPDGGYGPSLVTVAAWSVSCACWQSSIPFTEGAG
jgi:hypothetical protein